MNLNGTINGIKSKFNLNPSRDKSREEYVLNPKEHPENEVDPHEEEIRIREEELRKKSELLEIELAQLEHNKRKKIQTAKTKRLNLREMIETAKIKFSERVENHRAIFGISVLLFFASIVLHGFSFKVFLGIFLPSLPEWFLICLGVLFALSMEALAVTLYSEFHDTLAHGIYGVSLLTIIGMGVYQHSIGNEISIAVWRTGIGVIALVGLYAAESAIRKSDFWKSRKKWEQLPRKSRIELNDLFEKVLSEHKSGNTNYRLNLLDLCSTYNVKKSSLMKIIIRHGIRDKRFIAELPTRRRTNQRERRGRKAN